MQKNSFSQVFLIILLISVIISVFLFYKGVYIIGDIYYYLDGYLKSINVVYIYIIFISIFTLLWIVPTPFLAIFIIATTILQGFLFTLGVSSIAMIILCLVLYIFNTQFMSIARKTLFSQLRNSINNRDKELSTINLGLVSLIPIIPQCFKTYFYVFYKMKVQKLLLVLLIANFSIVLVYGFIGNVISQMIFKRNIDTISMLIYIILIISAITAMLLRISYKRKLEKLTK